MKVKHNKKRNTAFLYEALIRELTKSIVQKDNRRTTEVKRIIKEHFGGQKPLKNVLDCYQALQEKSGLDKYSAEKMIFRAKKAYEDIGTRVIFESQTKLIKEINKSLGSEVYDSFVPNYKNLATLAQIFGNKASLKSRVLMENNVLERLMSSGEKSSKMKPHGDLVVKNFIKRFNSQYGNLLPEQRDLLKRYVGSINENVADFRLSLLEELKRIRTLVLDSLNSEEVASDQQMVESTKKVLEKIDSYNVSEVSEKEILKILKMQTLVSEYSNNDNKD